MGLRRQENELAKHGDSHFKIAAIFGGTAEFNLAVVFENLQISRNCRNAFADGYGKFIGSDAWMLGDYGE